MLSQSLKYQFTETQRTDQTLCQLAAATHAKVTANSNGVSATTAMLNSHTNGGNKVGNRVPALMVRIWFTDNRFTTPCRSITPTQNVVNGCQSIWRRWKRHVRVRRGQRSDADC